jgi:CRP-like cAMP-binding protein
MFNQYSKHNFKELNAKLKNSINYNIKILAQHSKTKHLFYTNHYFKEAILAEQGNNVQGIYIIIKGKIKIFNVENSKETILMLGSVGDIVGLSSLNFEYYLTSIAALDEVEAYFISRKNLKKILKENPKLAFLLINYLSLNLQYFELRHKHNSLFSAKGKIIEALLLIANEFGESTEDGIELVDCVQRKELAALANTTYETVIRVLKKLELENAILLENQKIIIKDKESLLNSLKKQCNSMENPKSNSCSYLDLLY